jgi:hypothetical protein
MDRAKFWRLAFVVSLAFTGCGMLVSILSINVSPDAPLNSYVQSVFNLFYYVPATAWIFLFSLELLLLVAYWGYPKSLSPKAKSLVIFAICLLIFAFIYGLPHIVESNPRFVDSYIHGGTAKAISETGHLQPLNFSYQAYPSSFIFLSSLSTVSGIDITVWLRILPLILTLLFFFFLVSLVKELLGDTKIAVISAFIYGVTAYDLNFHFSPENFGWLLFFLFFILLARGVREYNSGAFRSRSFFAVFAIVTVAIATSHFVTQFMISAMILMLYVFGGRIWKTRATVLIPILVVVISFLAWASFFSMPYLASIFDGFKNAFIRVLSEPMSSIAAGPLQNYTPPGVAELLLFRRILYFVLVTLAFFGAYSFRKQNRRSFAFLFVLLIASLLPLPLSLVGTLPLERTIRLAFIPLSIFAAYLVIRHKKIGVLVLAFLLFTVPINFASLYYNEMGSNMTFNWEVNSAKFASSNFNGTILGSFKETGVLDFYGNFSKTFNDYHLLGRTPPDVFNFTYIQSNRIELVYITQLNVLGESTRGGLDTTLMQNSSFFNSIYSDGYSYFLLRTQKGG